MAQKTSPVKSTERAILVHLPKRVSTARQIRCVLGWTNDDAQRGGNYPVHRTAKARSTEPMSLIVVAIGCLHHRASPANHLNAVSGAAARQRRHR
jgi:hypothetical protein